MLQKINSQYFYSKKKGDILISDKNKKIISGKLTSTINKTCNMLQSLKQINTNEWYFFDFLDP